MIPHGMLRGFRELQSRSSPGTVKGDKSMIVLPVVQLDSPVLVLGCLRSPIMSWCNSHFFSCGFPGSSFSPVVSVPLQAICLFGRPSPLFTVQCKTGLQDLTKHIRSPILSPPPQVQVFCWCGGASPKAKTAAAADKTDRSIGFTATSESER